MITNELIHEFLHIAKEIFPIFFIAIVAAAVMDEYLPDSFIEKNFKKANFITVFNASLLGALVPMCTCGMIPFALKLFKKGLDWKVLVAFLTAGNASSIPALWVTMVLGWQITSLRFVTAIAFGILVAYLLVMVAGKNYKFTFEDSASCCEHTEAVTSPGKRIWHDIVSMLKDFVPWLLLAVLIASIFHSQFETLSTNPLVAKLNSSSMLGPWVFSAIGFPFYFCAGTDVPISRELLQGGVLLGSVISLMTAAPGVNLTSLLVYKQCVGLKKAIIFTLVSFATAALIGIIVNLIV